VLAVGAVADDPVDLLQRRVLPVVAGIERDDVDLAALGAQGARDGVGVPDADGSTRWNLLRADH